MVRRELIDDDDQFGFVLDTFRDKKHGLLFFINAMGVQQDGIWTDDQDPDYSYDLVWKSEAKITSQGYIAYFEIPFRSLRFSPQGRTSLGSLSRAGHPAEQRGVVPSMDHQQRAGLL